MKNPETTTRVLRRLFVKSLSKLAQTSKGETLVWDVPSGQEITIAPLSWPEFFVYTPRPDDRENIQKKYYLLDLRESGEPKSPVYQSLRNKSTYTILTCSLNKNFTFRHCKAFLRSHVGEQAGKLVYVASKKEKLLELFAREALLNTESQDRFKDPKMFRLILDGQWPGL